MTQCKGMASPKGTAHIIGKRRCEKQAKRDGYCTIHHPDRQRAKDAAKQEGWERQQEQFKKSQELEAAKDRVVSAALDYIAKYEIVMGTMARSVSTRDYDKRCRAYTRAGDKLREAVTALRITSTTAHKE